MNDLAIRVDGLSKSFRLGRRPDPRQTFQKWKSAFSRLTKRTADPVDDEMADDSFWALKDLSFEIPRGEVVGIVGRNGAGKSTLLKLLSRITYPTRGRIEIHGRVRSLLEVGTGFHDDLTGRENIYLNGAILGMSRGEIARKFDEIAAFSEVEKSLDIPVKHYSSGMYLRLAFAVAAHLDPEILILDEVLAVGDAAFQQKCIGKLGETSRQGKTVLIVSHSLPVVTNFCHRAMLLESGQITAIGSAADVVRQYMTRVRSATGEVVWPTMSTAPGNDAIRLNAVRILQSGSDETTSDVDIAREIDVQITYWSLDPRRQVFVAMALKDANGTFVLESSNLTSNPVECGDLPSGSLMQATCTIPDNFLNEGRYSVSVVAGIVPGKAVAQEESVLSFDVHDTGTMHEEYLGNWAGPIIRPRLPWNTIQKTTQPDAI